MRHCINLQSWSKSLLVTHNLREVLAQKGDEISFNLGATVSGTKRVLMITVWKLDAYQMNQPEVRKRLYTSFSLLQWVIQLWIEYSLHADKRFFATNVSTPLEMLNGFKWSIVALLELKGVKGWHPDRGHHSSEDCEEMLKMDFTAMIFPRRYLDGSLQVGRQICRADCLYPISTYRRCEFGDQS